MVFKLGATLREVKGGGNRVDIGETDGTFLQNTFKKLSNTTFVYFTFIYYFNSNWNVHYILSIDLMYFKIRKQLLWIRSGHFLHFYVPITR